MSRRCSYAGMHQSPLTTQQGQQASNDVRKISSQFSFEALRAAMYQRSLDVPSNRPSRRTSRCSDNPVAEVSCSQQSILNAMDRFVKAVNNMDSTVLVPNRLKDMELTGTVSPPHHMHADDLHAFFTMLNDVKNELLWGPDLGNAANLLNGVSAASIAFNSALRVPSVTSRLTHKRQPSDGSLGSTASDLETDNDSVSDYASDPIEPSMQLASAFRLHLQGLNTILHQLADSADYLALRYQEEVEPAP